MWYHNQSIKPTYSWDKSWSKENRNILQLAYGSGADFPQYVAFDTSCGYLRLICPGATWGTSVIVLPAVWLPGEEGPMQGAPLGAVNTYTDGRTYVLDFAGTIAGLVAQVRVRLSPPHTDAFQADVAVAVSGTLSLDRKHAHEAFRLVTLASMRISPQQWDTDLAWADRKTTCIPGYKQEITGLPSPVHSFGLRGGQSQWQKGKVAPSISIYSPQLMRVGGWVSQPGRGSDGGPNSDNVALWSAENEVRSHWQYRVTASLPTP